MCTGHLTQVWRNLCKKEEEDFFFFCLCNYAFDCSYRIKGEQGAIFFFNRNKDWSKSENHREKKIHIYTHIWINISIYK